MRSNALRFIGLTVCWTAAGLLLSASSCARPEPQRVPGQKLSYQDEYYLKQKEYQVLGEHRRNNNSGCRSKKCL
jgi:hypothetical protein